jgi:hypothetical protein
VDTENVPPSSRSPQPCFKALILHLLNYIAHQRGYLNSSLFLRDNSRWLISQWIEPSPETDENSDDNSNTKSDQILHLKDFPYTLLDPKCTTYKDFLCNYSSMIVPLICEIEDTRRRWRVLQDFCNDIGCGNTDGAMSGLFQKEFSAIRSLELLLHSGGKQRENNELVGLQKKACNTSISIQKFVDRFVSESDFKALTSRRLAETLRAFLCLFAFESEEGMGLQIVTYLAVERKKINVMKNSDDFIDIDNTPELDLEVQFASEALLASLQSMCDRHPPAAGITSVPILLAQCNLIDILAYLCCRLQETRLHCVEAGILAVVRVIAQQLSLKGPPKRPLIRAIIATLMVAVRHYHGCHHVHSVTIIFKELTSLLCSDTYRSQMEKSEGYNLIMSDIVQELFADMVCLYGAISECFKEVIRLNVGVVGNDETLHNDKVLKERDDQNSFINHCFSFLSSPFFESLTVEVLQSSLSILHYAIKDIIIYSRESYSVCLESILPLPDYCHNILPNDIQDSIVVELWNRPILEKISVFVNTSDRLLGGEPVSIMLVWLQLQSLRENLSNDTHLLEYNDPLVFQSQSNASTSKTSISLWRHNTDLIATFVSSLLGITKVNLNIQTDKILKNKCGTKSALRNEVIGILGLLGPPDLLTTNHGSLPARPGDALKSCHANTNILKLKLVMKAYGLLWGTFNFLSPGSQSAILTTRVASLTLNQLAKSNCLTDLLSYVEGGRITKTELLKDTEIDQLLKAVEILRIY